MEQAHNLAIIGPKRKRLMTDNLQQEQQSKPTWSTPKLQLIVQLDEAETTKSVTPAEGATSGPTS